MAEDSIDYEALVHSALRGVVRGALARAAESGLPGEHHFYVEFRTGAPGVGLAPRLRARFPERMTVVLQHRFWDLEVDEDGFAVTLSFDGRRERLAVPFAAVAAFTDPAASFALRFDPPEAPADDAEAPPAAEPGGETVVAVDFARRGAAGKARADE